MSSREKLTTLLTGAVAVLLAVAVGSALYQRYVKSAERLTEKDVVQTVKKASKKSAAKKPAFFKGVIKKLAPLHKKMGPPQPGDWLTQHKEDGQTFKEYVASKPVKPKGKRTVIYIQPLGDFTKTQRKIVTLTAEFMSRYFNVTVKVAKDIPLKEIPARARRKHPAWGMEQILSTYVLYDVLKPRLPGDAAAYIAFTATDLWPGKGWNFVFGQASLRSRVGVWSIYRNGNPDKDEKEFRLCLLRTIKTATHETGHMFSMQHCTAYECNMCGSNNREEADRRPVALCPECLAKVCWATDSDVAERFKLLSAFCKKQGLKAETDFYQKSLKAIAPAEEEKEDSVGDEKKSPVTNKK